MDVFENAKFGEMFETMSGRDVVYCGKFPGHKTDELRYHIFMFESNYEISLYDETGYGPYAFSVGSGSIFKPSSGHVDKMIKKYIC